MIKQIISITIWNFLVNWLGNSILVPNRLRYLIYKIAGMKTQSSNIRSGCMFRGKGLVIEKGVLINHNVFIDSWESVLIKENTSIAFDVMICTSSHKIGYIYNRAGVSYRRPIVIGKGCWIGARATILPGVTLGDGCVIAAGSVVNMDCNQNTLYAGVPAREVRTLV